MVGLVHVRSELLLGDEKVVKKFRQGIIIRQVTEQLQRRVHDAKLPFPLVSTFHKTKFRQIALRSMREALDLVGGEYGDMLDTLGTVVFSDEFNVHPKYLGSWASSKRLARFDNMAEFFRRFLQDHVRPLFRGRIMEAVVMALDRKWVFEHTRLLESKKNVHDAGTDIIHEYVEFVLYHVMDTLLEETTLEKILEKTKAETAAKLLEEGEVTRTERAYLETTINEAIPIALDVIKQFKETS
mmetsp:Transcript_12822/g.36269  ORF Transcript_12822/g.36269 Transcript_12822/m.36269 type:complete len:241 (-) Transcript_12822:206-928(-)